MLKITMTLSEQKAVFDILSSQAAISNDWAPLEAAHVLGQERLGLHFRSHWQMLLLAVRLGDVPEAIGQLFRLGLIPLGHLSGRLPRGNIGRSAVSAFEPMPISSGLVEMLERALARVQQRQAQDGGAGRQ